MDKRGVAALAVLVLRALLATCQPQGQPLPRALALVRLHFRVRSDVSYTEYSLTVKLIPIITDTGLTHSCWCIPAGPEAWALLCSGARKR